MTGFPVSASRLLAAALVMLSRFRAESRPGADEGGAGVASTAEWELKPMTGTPPNP